MKLGYRFSAISSSNLLAAASAALLLLGAAAQAQNSPVGSWDCMLSGSRNGLVYMTLSNDFSLRGQEIVVPVPVPKLHTNLVFTIPTTGLGERPPTLPLFAFSNLAGFFPVTGQWWPTDDSGHIAGFFSEIVTNDLGTVCSTNYLPISTNGPISSSFPTNITVTNDLGGFCHTAPTVTNVVPTGTYTMQGICYSNVGSSYTNQFETTATLELVAASPTLFCISTLVASNNGTNFYEQVCFNSGAASTNSTFDSSSFDPILTADPRTNGPNVGFCYYEPVFTNVTLVYQLQQICYVQRVTCSGGATNGVSILSGRASGNHLAFKLATPFGAASLTGRRASEPLDLSSIARWEGKKRQFGTASQESLFFSPFTNNVFSVTGYGGGLTYSGFAMVSAWNRIALALQIEGFSPSLRAVTGSFNHRGFGNTTGIDTIQIQHTLTGEPTIPQSPGAPGLLDRVTFEIFPVGD
ncbi:MAG: hypothetical protein C5B50_09035 [Verrucomicrobia bacterium]|nr:MAG: hypothetical protein C5B50_09035 [Verrucomicrobiota bacterium]